MNGTSIIASLRSFSFSSVLVAIIAGTPHPNPKIIGINALPWSPTSLCMNISIVKAALAKYPQSSRILKHKNIMTIIGKKEITPPTPPITASHMNDAK